MPKTYATLSLKEEGAHVLVVTLNRPEVLNAISTQMGRDWLDLFNGLAADPGELRCIRAPHRGRFSSVEILRARRRSPARRV